MSETILAAAQLAGRCANGYERGAGKVVHAVNVSMHEVGVGINSYKYSLCNKTHGARSAGWSFSEGDVNCKKCLKEMDKQREQYKFTVMGYVNSGHFQAVFNSIAMKITAMIQEKMSHEEIGKAIKYEYGGFDSTIDKYLYDAGY